MMKSFLKRLLFFFLPFIIYVCITIYIDPFNVIYETSNSKLIKLKNEISHKLNYPLFKIQSHVNNPKETILLGDSRVDRLKNLHFNKSISNLAYAGGTLPEIVDTFWFIVENYNISEVYIGVNLDLMNGKNNMNRIKKTIELRKSKLDYLFSHDCLKASFYIIKALISNKVIDLEKPSLDKEEFWQYQLKNSAKQHYENFRFSKSYINSLKEISNYCDKQNIELFFIIPPTHTDLQNRLTDYNLSNEKKEFRSILVKLADVYDFNYINNITKFKSNFNDPYHFNDSIAKIIADELITNKLNHAKYIQQVTE